MRTKEIFACCQSVRFDQLFERASWRKRDHVGTRGHGCNHCVPRHRPLGRSPEDSLKILHWGAEGERQNLQHQAQTLKIKGPSLNHHRWESRWHAKQAVRVTVVAIFTSLDTSKRRRFLQCKL
ncbi:hypothetical protein ACROYT_G011547 [Oculina patagonica]